MSDIFDNYDRNLYKIGTETYNNDLNSQQVINSSEGRVNPDQINSGTSIEQQQQYVGAIIAGKQNFDNDEAGYILGVDKGVPKFYIGDTMNYINWDGTQLLVNGIFNIGGTTITIGPTQDIQTYLDIIDAAGGGSLYLQNGTYTLTASIYVPSGCTLQGVSRDGVIIDCDSSYAVRIEGEDVYVDGDVSINNGDSTVTGNGTTFTSAMVGRYIWLESLWYLILTRNSATEIVIEGPYEGSNLTNSAYVISLINIATSVKKFTITNATGSGLIDKYTRETSVDDLFIYDCGVGFEMQYAMYPKLLLSSDYNDIGGEFTYVTGYLIDFSEFNYSASGNGLTLNHGYNSSIFNTSFDGNATDGLNMTDCSDTAIMSSSLMNNGGQGVELVSTCHDLQFVANSISFNTSDGVKLTATDDRISFSSVSIVGNGGYGINIAAATCDDTTIIAPAFNTNSSGNINDQGTNTFVSPQDLGAVKTYYSKPYLPTDDIERNITLSDNTLAYFWQFTLDTGMTVNSFSFSGYHGGGTTSTFDINIYSEDGQTVLDSITTAAVAASGLVETAVSALKLNTGNYYLGMVANTNGTGSGFQTVDMLATLWNSLNGYDMTSKPKLSGTKAVTAGILPATFDPVSDLTELTASQGSFLAFRLDY